MSQMECRGLRVFSVSIGALVRVAVVLMSFFVVGCDNEGAETAGPVDNKEKQEEKVVCGVCNELLSFSSQMTLKFGEQHAFSEELAKTISEVLSEGKEIHYFLALPTDLFLTTSIANCEADRKPRFDAWLSNIEQQAEAIAEKNQQCDQQCSQVNCGEYVDLIGLNQELIELLTMLEGRFMDAALSSADVPGLAMANTEQYTSTLQVLAEQGVNLVGELSTKLEADEAEGIRTKVYQQALIDHALLLEDIAQTTVSLQWSLPTPSKQSMTLTEVISRLAEGSRLLAYQYDQLLLMGDGGKATASILKDIAKTSVFQLGDYHGLLQALTQTTLGSGNQNSDTELVCYESLAVKAAVARELYSIAAESVTQCGKQQQCKTNATPLYDAITQNQQTTQMLVDKLSNINGYLDKVVYSYTAADCD